ncbi:MAG: hypothetical protein IIY06_02290 [Proteobacteria bacterium]|nr:hypothetical protein [Pseudomonadota bacterium]
MVAEVLYDFDDVINIVNERHEHIKFNEHIKKECRKERERQHKEHVHDVNKLVLRWCANAGYFLTGGAFIAVFFCMAMKFYELSALSSICTAFSATFSVLVEKRWRQF